MIGARVGIYSGKGVAFTGVLDGLNQTDYYAYSMRRLTVDFLISSPIVRLRRSSDNAEMDFSYSADTNCLDANSLETGGSTNIVTWMGSDTIYVVKVYKQTSTGADMAQSTAANQPIFDKSGFYYNTINIGGVKRWLLQIAPSITISYYSINAVQNTVNSTAGYYNSTLTDLSPETLLANGRISWRTPAQLQFGATFDAQGKYAWKCYWDGTNEYLNIGTKSFNRLTTKSATFTTFQWAMSVASTSNDTPIYEIIFRTGYDSSDVAAIEANQKSYYGV